MIAPARTAALDALRAVHQDRVALPDALARVRQRLTDQRDVALASEILIGTLRWRESLDYLIEVRSSRAADRLDALVLDILRISAYQLFHLDRVPASAVVNDAVALTKTHDIGFASGFVNAVLRRLADPRTRPSIPGPPPGDDRDAWVDCLATTWSHPHWLVARWLDRVGREATEARLRYNQAPAPVTLRSRTAAGRDRLLAAFEHAGVVTQAARFAPGALTVVSGHPFQAAVPEGLFVVQDEASQLVALFAGAERGQCVLDACASPGGKTTLIADAMGGTGLVVAADVRPARMRLLQDTVHQSGAGNVRLVRHDASGSLPYGERFDLVLVDAPCSGLGTLRRDPNLKWRRVEGDLRRLARTERRLLEHASRVVKPGGRLLPTCSSEPEENDEIAAWFLERHTGYPGRRADPRLDGRSPGRPPQSGRMAAHGARTRRPGRVLRLRIQARGGLTPPCPPRFPSCRAAPCRALAPPGARPVAAAWPPDVAVLGDPQVLPGYCLLLPDPVVPHLNALEAAMQQAFLADMARIGQAVQDITDAVRINYAIFGNVEPALHAHVIPRYEDEPADLIKANPWGYDWNAAPRFEPEADGDLLLAIRARLERTP